MYSGTTLTPLSGRVLGAHQKLDRLALGALRQSSLLSTEFPQIRKILYFEGINGPDAIKRKSPARDEPWHYFSPFDSKDTQLLDIIESHHDRLVSALRARDNVRAAFEAAWLAHAIVDGLTPAHHYPYEEELIELRGGEGLDSRTTIKDKLLMPGDTRRDQVKNNWRMWGPKGLLTTHGLFEWGIAAIIKPLPVTKRMLITVHEIEELEKYGVTGTFRRRAKEVASLAMYDRYYKLGWTPRLAVQVRNQLAPIIVRMVALAWYDAARQADVLQKVVRPVGKA